MNHAKWPRVCVSVVVVCLFVRQTGKMGMKDVFFQNFMVASLSAEKSITKCCTLKIYEKGTCCSKDDTWSLTSSCSRKENITLKRDHGAFRNVVTNGLFVNRPITRSAVISFHQS